ncbi:MAG: hypothetical protein IJ587_10930, partial [Synergistaceae bacterium]|nr:hypothetical protein [Synergistaceae bacterium]
MIKTMISNSNIDMNKIKLSNIRKGIKGIAFRVKVQDYALGNLAKATGSRFLQGGFEDCQTQLAEVIKTLESIEGLLALAEKMTPEEIAEADEDLASMSDSME